MPAAVAVGRVTTTFAAPIAAQAFEVEQAHVRALGADDLRFLHGRKRLIHALAAQAPRRSPNSQ